MKKKQVAALVMASVMTLGMTMGQVVSAKIPDTQAIVLS